MRTAVSLPEAVFKEAERFARHLKKSRSQLYAEAIREYLARRVPDSITEAMNSVCDRLREQDTEFATSAARKMLARESWQQSAAEISGGPIFLNLRVPSLDSTGL